MDIWQYLKKIYSGSENISNNVILFSLLGILSILFGKCLSFYIGKFYFGYFTFSAGESWICLFLFIIMSIYLSGYLFSFSNSIYSDEDNILPSINLKPFVHFIKMFPLFVFWIIIMMVLVFAALFVFNIKTEFLKIKVYYSVLFCLFLFINVLWIIYSKDFKNGLCFYSPLYLLKVIKNTGFYIISLTFKCVLLAAVLSFAVYKIFLYSNSVISDIVRYGLRNFALSVWFYFMYIICLINVFGIVKKTKSFLS